MTKLDLPYYTHSSLHYHGIAFAVERIHVRLGRDDTIESDKEMKTSTNRSKRCSYLHQRQADLHYEAT